MPRTFMVVEVLRHAHSCREAKSKCGIHPVPEGRSGCFDMVKFRASGFVLGPSVVWQELCADYLPSYVQVLATDFPDPGVKLIDGTYYAFGTNSNSGSSNISAATSKDLVRSVNTAVCATMPCGVITA